MTDGVDVSGWSDEAGRHRITVLAADIYGSTNLIQHLDPEAAASIMGPAMKAMVEEVERHKGVAAHRGDGVMAIFGPPSVCEDHALRACLAAIGIHARLTALGEPNLKARIGIHSGEAVVSLMRIGRASLPQATGVAVHVAARLEQSARPGAICISDAVLGLALGFVQTSALDAVTVKGVDEPVARHELLGVDPQADRWSVRAATGLGAIVNRITELATLHAMLAGSDGHALRIVQLAGPAGIGKSRLLHEFLSAEATRRCALVRFGGDQHRQHVPLHPIAGWLRETMRIGFALDVSDARAQIRAVVSEFAADPARAAEILGRLLGVDETVPPRSRASEAAEVADVVADLVFWHAGRRRLVLACEDFDLFDIASRELLIGLVERLRDYDALLVATTRSRGRLRIGRHVRMLNVAPLSREHTVDLLRTIAPEFVRRPEMTAAVAERAGGNPLFVEEVASLVLRTGFTGDATANAMPLQEGGRTPADAEPQIPERVESLIADRLAQMPRDLRHLVRLCAVIGLDVPLRLIAALTGSGIDELSRQLQRLESAQILYQTRVYPDPQFSFRHALIREVAYQALLASRRRDIHARIVAAIEADTDSPQEGRLDDLCFHALQARLWEPAFDYLRRAAVVAVQKFALQIAYSHLSRALEISRHLPDSQERGHAQLGVALEARPLLLSLGRYHDASRLLDDAEALATRLRADERLVWIMGWRCHVLNLLGELDEATRLGQRAFDAARATGNVALQQSSGHYLGQARFNAGDLKQADEVLAQMERLGEVSSAGVGPGASGSPLVLVSGTRTLTLALLGRFDEAQACMANAMRHAEATRNPYNIAFVRSADGIRLLQQCEVEAASATIDAGIPLAEEAGLAHLLLPLRIGLGHVQKLRGDYAPAWEVLSQCLAEARELHRHMMQIWAASGLAQTELRLGQPARAEESAQEALLVADRYGFRAFKVLATRTLGLVLLQQANRRAEARATFETALSLATSLGMGPERAHAHAALARLREGDAARHRTAAERLYGDMGIPVALALTTATSDERIASPAS